MSGRNKKEMLQKRRQSKGNLHLNSYSATYNLQQKTISNFAAFSKIKKLGMIFHENRLLADDSHEISYLFFFKLRKMSQNLSFAAVIIGALRVNS